MTDNNRLYWLGSEDMSLNKHTIRICGEITLGYYGGNSDSGAYSIYLTVKNLKKSVRI